MGGADLYTALTMKQIVFKISHDGKDWVISNSLASMSSPTLEELDAGIGALLRERGFIKRGEKARVRMEFDNSSIPQWIRQYSQHYFDRIVEIHG